MIFNADENDTTIRWRCDGTVYSDDHCSLFFNSHRVVKTTPRGEWVDVYGERKFVLNDSMKRYAYSTKKEALESFIRRKAKQARILSAQLKKVNALHKAATEKMTKDDMSNSTEHVFDFSLPIFEDLR
jgi:hypothetical protein